MLKRARLRRLPQGWRHNSSWDLFVMLQFRLVILSDVLQEGHNRALWRYGMLPRSCVMWGCGLSVYHGSCAVVLLCTCCVDTNTYGTGPVCDDVTVTPIVSRWHTCTDPRPFV